MGSSWRLPALVLVLGGASGLLYWAARPADISLEKIAGAAPPSAPAMCPWREPQRDMQAFFPGADSYRTDLLVLSSLRPQIMQELGPGTPLESNSLYVYRVLRGKKLAGSVLIRRLAGQHGAIEVVVGIDPDSRVAGARLQRHREPPSVARALTSSAWLGAFRGKTADSAWQPGNDLPAVPEEARESAEAVVRAARALLIEYKIGASTSQPFDP